MKLQFTLAHHMNHNLPWLTDSCLLNVSDLSVNPMILYLLQISMADPHLAHPAISLLLCPVIRPLSHFLHSSIDGLSTMHSVWLGDRYETRSRFYKLVQSWTVNEKLSKRKSVWAYTDYDIEQFAVMAFSTFGHHLTPVEISNVPFSELHSKFIILNEPSLVL